jgi:phosphoribosylaminoimidazole-succinocarboxamide synthase
MKTPIINNLELIAQGKVRDIYAIDEDHLLIVTTDRMSAFDVVLPDPIPGKGEILTQLSHFWFKQTENIVQNHLSDDFTIEEILEDHTNIDYYTTRSMVVKRLKPLPIEAVVRGYLIG